MKIVHLSDHHLRNINPQEGDVLCHTGDMLNYGTFDELIKFRAQLEPLKDKYKHILITPGNHDFCFEHDLERCESFLKETIPNVTVLHNKEIVIDGIKFYGTADQPEFFNWAYNLPPDKLKMSYANIPDDVDVLLTHCPPYGILDRAVNLFNPNGKNVGSKELEEVLPRLTKLKAHLFGHIHSAQGEIYKDNTIFSNACICNESYISVHSERVINING